MKYCVNCEWVLEKGEFSKCSKFCERSPVTGEPSVLYCNVARLPNGACGPDARGFESNEVYYNVK